MREINEAFGVKPPFDTDLIRQDVMVNQFTEYKKEFPMPVVFPPQVMKVSVLAARLSRPRGSLMGLGGMGGAGGGADREAPRSEQRDLRGKDHFPVGVQPRLTDWDWGSPWLSLRPRGRARAQNVLSEWISKKGLKQYHVAETEKYAHVTFFFNGGQEKQFEGEERCMVRTQRLRLKPWFCHRRRSSTPLPRGCPFSFFNASPA